LRFFSRWTCNRSEPGECCKAEIATSRSRCSCCKRASCSRNSRSSSLVIATAGAWAAAKAPGPRLCVQTRSGFHLPRFAAPDHHLSRRLSTVAGGSRAPIEDAAGRPWRMSASLEERRSLSIGMHARIPINPTLLRCTSKRASKTRRNGVDYLSQANDLAEENPPTCP